MNEVDMFMTSVAQGGTTTPAIPLDGDLLLGTQLPAGLDATAMTILKSLDGVTFQTIYRDGADKTWTVAASKYLDLKSEGIIAKEIKFVFGTAQDPAVTFQVDALRLS